MPPSQSHTPPTLNEALPPQPSIFVAASASKDPGAWRRGTRATTTFFPSSASEDGPFPTANTGSKQAQLFNGNIFVGTPLHRLLRFYFYKMQTEKNKLLGSPYACVAVQMQPAMECHNELR
uniref:Uncharacterized protein n=1 Tax=Oryza nivara TaxID=4536 RepID=A0A0E0I9R7_ORYNI